MQTFISLNLQLLDNDEDHIATIFIINKSIVNIYENIQIIIYKRVYK